jgi:hypothetical protein
MIQQITEDVFVDLVKAAVNNRYVREYHKSPQYKDIWSTEHITHRPPIRVHFENAIVFGTVSEAISIAKNKTTWGHFIGIEALGPEDFLDPQRIVYSLKATSKVRMRWEFRDTFKNILSDRRRLVNDAVRESKRDFLKYLKPEDGLTIRRKLELSPEDFWVACRYGERFGPNAIHNFVARLEEHTVGYRLPFDVPLGALK